MAYPQNHANLAAALIATPPSPATSGTSLTVASGKGSLFPASNFSVTLYPPGVEPTAANAEIALCTSRTGDVLTITRAQEGTSAKSVAAGWQIANTLTALQITEIENAISGGGAVWGGITGTLSAQTDLQTALNAKLTAASNLSDVVTPATARTNLGLAIGTNVQAFDAVLADLAGLTLAQGDVLYYNGTNLVNLGPGSNGQFLQTQGAGANPQWASSGVAGALLIASNLSDLNNTTTARSNLGVAIGTNVQAQSALLQDIANETFAQGDIIYYNGTNLVNLGPGTAGQLLQTNGAGANPSWVTAGGVSGITMAIAKKTSNQDVTNNASFQNDTELQLAVVGGVQYHCEFYIIYSGNDTTGDYQSIFAIPTMAFTSDAIGQHTNYNTNLTVLSTTTAPGDTTTAWPDDGIPTGVVDFATTLLLTGSFTFRSIGNGTLIYQFCNISPAVGRTSRTNAGSWIMLTSPA